MPRLIVLSGDDIGREFALRGEMTLGRNAQCAVHLSHSSVSREHAKLAIEGEQATIVDLQSSNGTFVNGKRVERAQLQPGDEIRLGQFTLRFAADVQVEEIRLQEEPEIPVATPAPSSPPPAMPSKPAADASRKKISESPVRPVHAPASGKTALIGQDVLQYGGYYRFALLLGGLLLAAGVFLGVKWISAKIAAKQAVAEESEEPR